MISFTCNNNSDTNNAKSSVGKSKGQSIGAPYSSMTILHVKIRTLSDSDVVRHIKCPHFLSDFDDRDLFFSMIFPWAILRDFLHPENHYDSLEFRNNTIEYKVQLLFEL